MRFQKLFVLWFLSLIISIAVLSFTIFTTQQPQDSRQHAAGVSCNNTGVTRNADGSYSFALLHVDNHGNLTDRNNCIIHLLGMNTGNTYWGNAEHPDLAAMTFYKTHVTFNVIRLNYQAYWWDTNVNVPDRNIGYKQWIQQIITWAKSLGLYVILDTGPEYHALPCGPGNPVCPSQNAGSLTGDPTQQIDYEPTALQSLSELSALYGSDPAIIWDVWNEPANRPTDISTLISDYNERMNMVKQNAPNAVFQVYSRAIEGGANFSQGNIMEDFHDYNGTDLTTKIQAARAKGIATIVAEYGGSAGPGTFMNTLVSYTQNYNTNLVYYEDANLFNSRKNPTSVTANGQQMSSAYSSIFGNFPPTATPTSSISLTTTPTLTPNAAILDLIICPHGLGNCGDNASSSGGNASPSHTTRNILLFLTDASNNAVSGSPFSGHVNYGTTSQNFQGTLSLPLPNGHYLAIVQMDGFLKKQIPGIITVTQGQHIVLPQIFLVTGDSNNDNQLDIQDYNILLSCFGSAFHTAQCLSPEADINDDGSVDGVDYTLFLGELSVQKAI